MKAKVIKGNHRDSRPKKNQGKMHLAKLNNRNYYHRKVLTLFLQSFGFQSRLIDMPHTTAMKYFVKQSAIYPKIC
jgi:hypothetical protein